MTIYLGPPLPAGSSGLPEDGAGRPYVSSYLALLRVGFARRPHYCGRRCALTAPFHPYPAERGGMFLLHFPSSRLARVLPGTLPSGARTFLPPDEIGTAATQPPGSPLLYHGPVAGLRRSPVQRLVGQPIGDLVLLSRHMHEGDAVESRSEVNETLVEWNQLGVLDAIAAFQLPYNELRVHV